MLLMVSMRVLRVLLQSHRHRHHRHRHRYPTSRPPPSPNKKTISNLFKYNGRKLERTTAKKLGLFFS